MSDDADEAGVFLFNPLPWERELSGVIPPSVTDVRGDAADPTASRHSQDRGADVAATLLEGDESSPFGNASVLPPTRVPGYGYATISSASLDQRETRSFDERAVVTTDRYEITFDRESGGIERWYDEKLDCEWVDSDATDSLAGFVHEHVADESADDPRKRLFRYPHDADWAAEVTGLGRSGRGFQSDWHAEYSRPTHVNRHRVYDTPLGYDVRQRLATPVVESDVVLRVLVPHEAATITVDAAWIMGDETRPEATYLRFPFAIDDPTARVDVGGQAMRPGSDQLADTCHDYYTAQRWVDLSGPERGVTVACPLNPIVQFGDARFGDDRRSFELDDAHFSGWVTNNYWETNFRAHQPGAVHARYHLTPHSAFNEGDAHRAGLAGEHHVPLAQTLGEAAVSDAPLPTEGQLLDLPDLPVLVQQIRPSGDGDAGDGVFVLLRNASDEAQSAQIASAELSVVDAHRVTVLGGPTDGSTACSVAGGTATVSLEARETAAIRLSVSR